MEQNYKDFTDLLKDNLFLRWQMNPDELLEEHWKRFMEENPHLEVEVNKAKSYLKDTVLNKSTLSSSDRINMLRKIESEIGQNRRKKKKRFFLLISAISAAAVFLLIFSLNIFNRQISESPLPQQEIIVGNLLNDVDIQLVTADKTMSFGENVQMEFDDKGKANIVKGNKEEHESLDLVGSKSNKLIVPFGKRSSVTLADGSKVWLNSGSVLEFPAQFEGNRREINLHSGEIYLEVAENRQIPFYVKTKDLSVKVLGTKFNISNYTNLTPSVVLVEGSVSVQSGNSKQTVLIPGEQVVLAENGDLNKQEVDIESLVSWRNGYLLFRNAPLIEVMKQIERYYNLSFSYEQSGQISKITCDGKLVLTEDIDDVMKTVAFLSKSNYHRENNKIYMFSND